jgi:translation initiation factor IF-2
MLVVVLMQRSSRPGFVRGNRPAIVAKVEPTEGSKKPSETLEKLQGKEEI